METVKEIIEARRKNRRRVEERRTDDRGDEVWSQRHEMNFLHGLGTHSYKAPRFVRDVPPLHRIFLLEGYLHALENYHRRWFYDANPPELRAICKRLIHEEKVKCLRK